MMNDQIEKALRNLLERGLNWLDLNPAIKAKFASSSVAYGVLTELNADAEKLEAIIDSNGLCSGAAYQAVITELSRVRPSQVSVVTRFKRWGK